MWGQSQWGKGEWGKAVNWQPETGLFGEPTIRHTPQIFRVHETPQLPIEISRERVKQINEQPRIESIAKL